jgi:hypothetical protein
MSELKNRMNTDPILFDTRNLRSRKEAEESGFNLPSHVETIDSFDGGLAGAYGPAGVASVPDQKER